MKTKLLKKIRKEWVVYRVDSYGNNSHIQYLSIKLGLPFYISSEVDGSVLSADDGYRQTFQEAKDRVLQQVKSKYEPIFIKDKCTPKMTKVWHI